MFIFFTVMALLAVLIDVAALLFWRSPGTTMDVEEFPMVSVLVAMRDEEQNVTALITCLKELEYPYHRLEFVIGDDRSTDQTLQNLHQVIDNDPRFKVVSIESNVPGLIAKANVIAQLIPHCSSSYYFITDADVRIPRSWITGMLSALKRNDGAVGGVTLVEVKDLWTGLQNLEWMIAQGLVYVAGGIYGTIAISGTNMMITGQACAAVGGYQNMPYPLTEDIGILTAFRRHGFSATNAFNTSSVAKVAPLPNFKALVAQRARWTYGALRMPPVIVLSLMVRSLFLLALLVLFWHQPILSLALFLIKFLVDLIFIKKVGRSLGQKVILWHFIWFEIYWLIASISGLLKYLSSQGITWKGRTFK